MRDGTLRRKPAHTRNTTHIRCLTRTRTKVMVEINRDLGRIIQKYTLNDLEKGSTYHFRVRARNCSGWGNWGPPSEAVGAAVTKKDERRTSVIDALASGDVRAAASLFCRVHHPLTGARRSRAPRHTPTLNP